MFAVILLALIDAVGFVMLDYTIFALSMKVWRVMEHFISVPRVMILIPLNQLDLMMLCQKILIALVAPQVLLLR